MSRTHTANRRPPAASRTGRSRHRRLSAAETAMATAAIGAVATVTAAALGVFGHAAATPRPAPSVTAAATASRSPRPSATPLAASPRIPGDNSSFVADVTYPDGSTVTEGQHFIKKWEIKNIGDVLWTGRYLAPDGQYTGSCTYPSRVPVPTTRPGQDVIISVPVTASDSPGLCYVTWKMETANGAPYFPDEIGIWFKVQVVAG
jgi:hypothetical protein